MPAVHPAVPLNPGTQGLSVGIVSYDCSVCFGLLADRDLDPPLAVAADGLRAALHELTARRAVDRIRRRGLWLPCVPTWRGR